MCFAPRRRAFFRHLNFQKWSGPGVLCTFWLRNVLRATTACNFSTSQLPKVVRTWFALYILTSKCASRHNGVHFFDISTSKSGPDLVCFVHFDFEMCFAPRRRAFFRHLNFQKWSGPGVLCTFWLRNVLRATTACNFSTSQLPKVVRTWCALYILTSKCASRHNGVHFFDISTSKSGPDLVCFVHFDFEMCFAPQRRAFFRHLNFQKWSGPGVLCAFWLRNVLRATMACNFSTSQLPKVVRTWCVLYTFWLRNVLRATTACNFSTSQLPKVVRTWFALYILTSKCASRHNGVHFFDISTSKSGPDLVCFVHFDFEMCFAPRRRAFFRHLNFQKWSGPGVLCTFWLRNVLRATTACNFSTSQLPKVVRTWCALYILTSKCASRHNGVHFFDISTSKSGPDLVCFVHFDFEMCFAPQRRAFFRHLNFQKWSGPGVLCAFWLRNVLRATMACNFSTSQLPKVVRTWCVLYTFWLRNVLRAATACNFSSLICPTGSAPAALASLLFDPPQAQIMGKTQCFATFLPFRAPGSSFFLDFLVFDLLSSSLLFSDSSPLCFLFVHIVRSLTSKLPSIMVKMVIDSWYWTNWYSTRSQLIYGCLLVDTLGSGEIFCYQWFKRTNQL